MRVLLVLCVTNGRNRRPFEISERLREQRDGDQATDRLWSRPTRHEVGPDVVFAADMNAHIISERETNSPMQHLASSCLTNIRHNHEQIKDEYEIVVVGEQIIPICT